MKRERRQPTRREGAEYLVDVLRQLHHDRPHCRGFDAKALVLWFRNYLPYAPDEAEVEEALEVIEWEGLA